MKRVSSMVCMLLAMLVLCASVLTYAEGTGGSAQDTEKYAMSAAASMQFPGAEVMEMLKTTQSAQATATPTASVSATAMPTASATPTAMPTTSASATAAPTASASAMATPTASPVAAQEADDESAAEAEETIPLGLAEQAALEGIAGQNAALSAEFEAAMTESSYYADYYFGSAQTMSGIFSYLQLYAHLPDYTVPTSAVLRFSYSCSDLILTDISSLTFYMNGVPFKSVSVVKSSSGQSVQYLRVPIELMQTGYNLLEISGYVRLTDDEGCTDDFNGANWIRFSDTTCLRIGYELSDDADEIAMFPYPFLSLMDKTGADFAIAVSDYAETDELKAALTLMADLGAEVSAKNDIDLARIGETKRSHIVYFGLRENTPERLLTLLDQEVPPTGALIQRVTDGEKEYMLVISNEGEALHEAACFLSDSTRYAQVHEKTSFISVGESSAYIAARQNEGLALEGMYSLKDLLGHGAGFSGPFEQSAVIYLPVAEDYTLSSESRFTLNIRYSENLDFERSLMTVYWGDSIPLFSRKLSKDGASGEVVSFSVPADAVGQSSTFISVVFDLEIQDLDCTPRQLNMPWAYIAEDSTFYLPSGENTVLSLGNRPAPFQRSSLMNDVLVVLPDMPKPNELILAGRVMAMMGAGSEPYGVLNVIHASEFNEADSNYNVIAVGIAGNHSFIRKLNDSLYFQYSGDMAAIQSNDKLILNDAYARESGTIQLISSPYGEGKAALVVSAAENSGISALVEQISAETKRWSLTKEAVLVDSHGKATSYQFTTAARSVNSDVKPSFAQVVAKNREPMLFMLIGLSCMTLVLLGVIIVLIRLRRQQKKGE